MKFKFAIIPLFFVLFTTAVWAQTPKPAACPTINAIQGGGLAFAEALDAGIYVVAQIDNYGTNERWAFIFPEVEAISDEEALNKGVDALKSLTGGIGPIHFAEDDVWGCLYYSLETDYMGVALTPVDFNMKHNASLAHRFK